MNHNKQNNKQKFCHFFSLLYFSLMNIKCNQKSMVVIASCRGDTGIEVLLQQDTDISLMKTCSRVIRTLDWTKGSSLA